VVKVNLDEKVNPGYYKQGKVECIDAIESALGLDGFIAFLRGQVIKYTWRVGGKDNPVQETMKAAWYNERLLKALSTKEALESK
jgi:hypothetical protein